MTYRFFGSVSEIGETKLEKLGSEIKFTVAEAINALEGGAQLLPKEQFDAIFSAQDTMDYPFLAHRETAPPEFKNKIITAAIAVVAHLDELKKGANRE